MLLYFFAKGHCFIDGNKRVSAFCAITFLKINGYKDNLNNEIANNKIWNISESKIVENLRDDYINSIAEWLSQYFT